MEKKIYEKPAIEETKFNAAEEFASLYSAQPPSSMLTQM